MRTIRTRLLTAYSVIGMVFVFGLLLLLTGHLVGIVTPHRVAAILATGATAISSAPFTWWLVALVGWALGVWTTGLVWKWRAYPPILVSEDETGMVEVAPEAICSLARSEIRAQQIPGGCRAEFTGRLGSPMLQIWCDLASGENGDGPAARGTRLKSLIERRLREELDVEGVKVAVIHQPIARTYRRTKPQAVA